MSENFFEMIQVILEELKRSIEKKDKKLVYQKKNDNSFVMKQMKQIVNQKINILRVIQKKKYQKKGWTNQMMKFILQTRILAYQKKIWIFYGVPVII